MKRLLLAAAVLLAALSPWLAARADNAPPAAGDTLQISLLTFGPGTVYWERFGHNAILVRDTATGSAIAYNYGIFDFNQKNFFLNFMRGYMTYRMAADPLVDDLMMYDNEGRAVTEQPLNLTPAQRQSLADFLRWNARPENARYRYDYFRSNCSTRVRDALDQAVGHRIRDVLQAVPAPAGHTYRYEAVRLLSPDLWLAMAMDIALGPPADRPLTVWQQTYVPAILSQALPQVTVTGADGTSQPLVGPARTLVPSRLPPAPASYPHWLPAFTALGLAMAALLLVLSRSRQPAGRRVFAALALLWSLVTGIGGLILAAIWGLTQHWAGWYNENLLLFDPLALLLLPGWIACFRGHPPSAFTRRLAAVIGLLAVASLIVRLVPGAYQHNLHWIALLLPSWIVQTQWLYRARLPKRRA